MQIYSGSTALTQYQLIRAQPEMQYRRFDSQASVKAELSYFEKHAGDIHNVDDLLNDRRIMGFVLSGFQLEDQVDSRGLLKKLLTEDPEKNSSVANRLIDPRYRQFALALVGLDAGIDPFNNDNFRQSLVNAWKVNEYEKFQGNENPAIRQALYFQRKATGITSINQLLADKTLFAVARTALGLPQEFAALDFDQIKARMTKLIDIEDFSDPAKLHRFTERFLVQSDLENGFATSPLLSLFGSADNSYSPVDLFSSGINLFA